MTDFHDVIVVVARVHGIAADLVEAVVVVESNARADAFRFEPAFYQHYIKGKPAKAGQFGPLAACSFGPMQIMLETACELGFVGQPWDLFDVETGVTWGAWYLRTLLDWADGDVMKALSAYNGGKGTAAAPPYANQAYVDRVLNARKGLR